MPPKAALRAAVSQVPCVDRYAMNRRPQSLEDFASRARELYTLPAVAMQVLSLADDSQADAARLKRTIELDPALTAKILRVVNSSLFGLTRQIADLGQAVALVGVKALKLLTLGFSLPERMFANKGADVLRHYWTRTLTRAVACRELAAAVGNRHAEEAFIAGLLGDLGTLVFLQEGGDRYLAMYRRAQDGDPPLCVAERRYYGFHHTDLTVRLLTDWKLPGSLCENVRQGLGVHAADEEPGHLPAMARLLQLADHLSAIVVDERTDLWPQMLDDAAEFPMLRADRLAEISERVQDQVRQLADVLNLELVAEHSFREVVQRAHQRLAGSSEEVVEELLRARRKKPDARDKAELEHELEHELLGGFDDLRDDARRTADGDGQHRNDGHDSSREGSNAGSTAAGDTLNKSEIRRAAAQRGVAPTKEGTAAKARRRSKTIAAPAPESLLSRLDELVTVCRQARAPLSLVLVELDRFKNSVEKFGPLWGEYTLGLLNEAVQAVDWPTHQIVRDAQERWAVVLPGVDRRRALQLVNEMIRRFRLICPVEEAGATTLSFGTATVNMPPRDFPAEELRTAAARCLYAAQAAAGDTSKSIEMC
ncbi:MAG: hypothetical protein C0483_25690 [Pirellula sp.]|nr:hypothetical protein [Pirellula sp.]